jgi:hypothetical protein
MVVTLSGYPGFPVLRVLADARSAAQISAISSEINAIGDSNQ